MYDRLCMIDYVHYVHVLNALDMHARAHTHSFTFLGIHFISIGITALVISYYLLVIADSFNWRSPDQQTKTMRYEDTCWSVEFVDSSGLSSPRSKPWYEHAGRDGL
jgi:hypothetical protein